MVDHSTRDHATWSASASERNFLCPGALALTMHLPEDTSEAADWGTCCHQVAEKCLRQNIDADSLIGTIEKGKKYENEVDEEMAETAQTYVDYVRKLASGSDAKLLIEQKFSLASLNPPFDAGGTGDAVIYLPAEKRLEIVDLKGGRGVVVAATGNPQLRTYALGAMLANRGISVQRVTVTIVQPRASHPDGRIRSETFHIADLVEWTTDLLAAMTRAKEAVDVRDLGDSEEGMAAAAWAAKYLRPGDHCRDTFCKARATCPALKRAVEDEVGVWFNEIDQPQLANAPDSGTPDERARRLDMLDMIEDWIKAVRAHEHRMAEMGSPATGYVLVEKEGREKWIDEKQTVSFLAHLGVSKDLFLNEPKAKTPKQVRAALKKAKIEVALSGRSEAPKTGTNLVRADQTTRSPVGSTAERYFQHQPD